MSKLNSELNNDFPTARLGETQKLYAPGFKRIERRGSKPFTPEQLDAWEKQKLKLQNEARKILEEENQSPS